MSATGKKRLRQAAESDGSVAVLCYACRRSTDTTKQVGIANFFTTAASSTATPPASTTTDGPLLCSRCRCSMEKRVADRSGGPKAAGGAGNGTGAGNGKMGIDELEQLVSRLEVMAK